MKEKIKKILFLIKQWKVILIIISIGMGLFYWYQIRPSQIYSACHTIATKKAQSTFAERYPYEKEKIERGWYLQYDYEVYYKQCLRLKGVNK